VISTALLSLFLPHVFFFLLLPLADFPPCFSLLGLRGLAFHLPKHFSPPQPTNIRFLRESLHYEAQLFFSTSLSPLPFCFSNRSCAPVRPTSSETLGGYFSLHTFPYSHLARQAFPPTHKLFDFLLTPLFPQNRTRTFCTF